MIRERGIAFVASLQGRAWAVTWGTENEGYMTGITNALPPVPFLGEWGKVSSDLDLLPSPLCFAFLAAVQGDEPCAFFFFAGAVLGAVRERIVFWIGRNRCNLSKGS